jgi:cobalt-zinc-cadmium efflux system outer membrane protein
LDLPPREFELSALVAQALQNRRDLMALRHARDAAQSNVTLEKANRIPNVDVGGGWNHSTTSHNSIAPSPPFDDVTLSFSFPLPLWNRNRAAIASAGFSAEQARLQVEAAELKAEVQVRQTLSAYRGAVERLKNYQNGILKNADAVVESKRFSYQRGQATLLELLDAERTDNEVRSRYNDTLAEHAKALIELERATQLWDLQF